MADISAFRGVRYDTARISDPARVVAPPYDMISPEEQLALYERDPHNVVRLILGLQLPTDREGENRYTRAAATLQEWLASGVLRRDERPSVYVYDQEYALSRGERRTRRGFIALARLEELGAGSIHPHERTLSGPKEDRLRLMQACHANFSQVFSFYDDPAGDVETVIAGALPQEPQYDVTDGAGVRHVLYALREEENLTRLAELMRPRTLFIADGHHRYETALAFRKQMREQLGASCPEAYDWIMMYFANMSSPGMTILPFHRLVSLPAAVDPSLVRSRLAGLGRLEERTVSGDNPADLAPLLGEMAAPAPGEHRFGVVIPPRRYLFSVRREGTAPGGGMALVEDLDVSILHREILPGVLGEHLDGAQIAYHTREQEIGESLASGRYGLAFLLNPTRIEQVRDIAAAGLRMPPKSTNFHPKLISGLVLNLLRS